MQEKDANGKARDALRLALVPSRIYKHNDRGTKGMPDTSVIYNEYTSWLEFKMLHGDETVWNELDPLQHVELLKLERACHRAWVVAYRKGNRHTGDALTIYRPSALTNKQQPVARELSSYDNVLRDLQVFGVARFEGFDHGAVVALVKATHASY